MNQLVKRNTALEVQGLFEKNRGAIEASISKCITADRLARIGINSISQTPQLQRCTPVSLFRAVIGAGMLGLEPGGPLQEAHLVPFGDQATLIIGWRGMVTLARRSGLISQVKAHIVCENDEFDWELGLDEKLRHVPAKGDRGKPELVYAIVKYIDGESDFEVMTTQEVEKIRKAGKGSNSPAWRDWWGEMARKSVLKRLLKRSPLSIELARATQIDDAVSQGVTPVLDIPNVEVPEEAVTASPIEQPAELNPGPLGVDPEAVKAKAEPEKVSAEHLKTSLAKWDVSPELACAYIIHDDRLGWLEEGQTLGSLSQNHRRTIIDRLPTFTAAAKAFESEDLAKAEVTDE